MKLKKRLLSAAAGAAIALTQTLTFLPAVNAADELKDAIANSSGVEYDFARALQYSMYFYDANMCGTDVEGNNRFEWRGNCHTYDAKVPLHPIEDWVGVNLTEEQIEKYRDLLDPDGDGCVDVAGGFHDAGDHVEFGMPENYAASTVGWGYYEFRDSYIKIGEQEHIETILRHFNDYLMKCTFLDENGDVVLHCYQVGDGDEDHDYWNSPEMDTMGRPAFFLTPEKPQTDYCVSAAASLAINYLNFKDTDPEYAQKNLDYAEALFKFAKDHPKELSDNGDGPKGYYRSGKWEDDYCWAAAWLYKITGDHMYLEEIYPNYDYYAAPCYVHCWNDVWGGVQCVLGEICMDKPAKEGEHVYPDFIEEFKKAANKSPYEEMNCWASVEKAINTYMTGGVGKITPQGYWWLDTWGSARYNTAAQLMALVYTKYNGNTPGKYSDWAKGQMEYIMGKNDITYLERINANTEAEKKGEPAPWSEDELHGSRCFIVGYNENSAAYPHHRASSGLTKCEDPDPQRYVLFGALAGGPDNQDRHDDITKNWTYNEVTIDYNAAFVGASAGLYEFYGTPEMAPTSNFPPKPTFNSEEGGGGSNAFWVTACGIDDLNANGAGVTKVSLYVMTGATKKVEDLSVRYYFSTKGMSNPNNVKPSELYDQAATEAAPANGEISGPYKYDKMDDVYYVEIKWSDYYIANSGKKYQFTVGLYYGDSWVPSDDWSYNGLTMYKDDDAFFATGTEVKTDNICVYSGDTLIGGIEPDGSVPATEEPTTSQPSTGEDKTPDVLYGDANCDKTVDISDAVLIMQNQANPEKYTLTKEGIANADCVDNPKGVTPTDALAIQMIEAKSLKTTDLPTTSAKIQSLAG